MKLKLKAYKYSFTWNSEQDRFIDPLHYQIMYGTSQREAVNKICLNDEGYTFWQMKQAIRTQRFKEADLYIQETSSLLKDLPEKLIFHLLHSLGVTKGEIAPKEHFRNYSFYGNKHENCEKLVKLGLMESQRRENGLTYHVTIKGINAVKTLLLITKT